MLFTHFFNIRKIQERSHGFKYTGDAVCETAGSKWYVIWQLFPIMVFHCFALAQLNGPRAQQESSHNGKCVYILWYQNKKLLIKSLLCFCLSCISHNILSAMPTHSKYHVRFIIYTYFNLPKPFNHTTTMSCKSYVRFVIRMILLLEKHR